MDNKRHPEDIRIEKPPEVIPKRLLRTYPVSLGYHFACNSREIDEVPHANSFWFDLTEELDSE